MEHEATPDEKRMQLRYAGSCRVCGADLPAGTEAVYERAIRTVRCVVHLDSLEPEDVIDVGTPGASARQEFERRDRRRHVARRHRRLGF